MLTNMQQLFNYPACLENYYYLGRRRATMYVDYRSDKKIMRVDFYGSPVAISTPDGVFVAPTLATNSTCKFLNNMLGGHWSLRKGKVEFNNGLVTTEVPVNGSIHLGHDKVFKDVSNINLINNYLKL